MKKIFFVLLLYIQVSGCQQYEAKKNKELLNSCQTTILNQSFDTGEFNKIIGKKLLLKWSEIIPTKIEVIKGDSFNNYRTEYKTEDYVLMISKERTSSFYNTYGVWLTDSVSIAFDANVKECRKDMFGGNFNFRKMSDSNYLFEHYFYDSSSNRFRCRFIFSDIE